MSETSRRYIALLSNIPRPPEKTTVRKLQAKLESQGYHVHKRSIERDLQKLSIDHPLVSDEGRPAGWSWKDRDTRLTFPRMDEGTALTYQLISRYLAPVLPKSMRDHLGPDFAEAERVLDHQHRSPLGRWSKRIAVLWFGYQLLPPEVRQDVGNTSYEALLQSRRFEADYRSLDRDEVQHFSFNPLGIVYRDGVLYLVATVFAYDDIRHYALHRMSNARLTQALVTAIRGFDFERYVREEMSYQYPAGKSIQLQMAVAKWLARHLDERRLSTDQTIRPIRGGDRFHVTATVMDSEQLFWWLSSLGTNVEVMKPAALRRRFLAQAKALTDTYARSSRQRS